MDFAYDKVQRAAMDEDEPLVPQKGPASPSSIDVAADKLEEGIEKAYTRLVGSQDWGSLWATVKSKGESAFKETTREVSSFIEKQKLASNSPSPSIQNDLSSSQETLKAGPSTSAAPNTTKGLFEQLTQRAETYIDGLDRELETIENTAGEYVRIWGNDLKGFLKNTIRVSPGTSPRRSSFNDSEGEDASPEILFDVPDAIRNQIHSTRLDAQLHALHDSPDPFLAPLDSEPQFQSFASSFSIDDHTSVIAEHLDQFPKLRKLMESLVPEKTSYNDFWLKYYYMRRQIDDQEAKRKAVLQRAQAADNDQDEIPWEDDDEDEDEVPAIPAEAAKKPRSSDDGSYDMVSANSSNIDLKRTINKDSEAADEDDDDDDWE